MASFDFDLLQWTVNLILPIVSGVLFGWAGHGRWTLFVSAAIPWLAFLAVNIYGEQISSDWEIVHGSWVYVQAIGGTAVGLLAMVSFGGITWVKRRLSGDHV